MEIKELIKKVEAIQKGNNELYGWIKHCYHEYAFDIPSSVISIVHKSMLKSIELEEELREVRHMLRKEIELRGKSGEVTE